MFKDVITVNMLPISIALTRGRTCAARHGTNVDVENDDCKITNQGVSELSMPAGTLLNERLQCILRRSVLGKTPNSLNRCPLSSDYSSNAVQT